MNAPQERRILSFDPLRLLLIVAVWTNHGLILGGQSVHVFIEKYCLGGLAVQVFFVLSGFLITGGLLKSKQRGRSLGDFWMKRTARIFPSYFLFLILASFWFGPICVQFGMISSVKETRIPASAWLYLINWARPVTEANDYIGHLWSLSVEEQFYLIWPIVVYLVGAPALKRSIVHLLGLPIAAAVVMKYIDIGMIYYSTPTNLLTLGAGASIAYWRQELELNRSAMSFFIFIFGFGGAFVYTRGGVNGGPQYVGRAVIAIAIVLCFLFIVEPILERRRHLRVWVISKHLGVMTYGLYLYHFPVFFFIQRLPMRMARGGVLGFFRACPNASMALVTFLMALLSYVLMEMWCIKGAALLVDIVGARRNARRFASQLPDLVA